MMLSKRPLPPLFPAALHSLLCLAVWTAATGSLFAAETPDPRAIHFETDVRPILREHCLDCHGASDEIEGGLDLRLVRFMLRGGDSGPAIVPGRPDDSHLLELVRSGEMPPGEHRVPEEQVAVLERWIAGGATTVRDEPESIGPGVPLSVEDRSYWAYQPLEPKAIPECAGIDSARLRTPVDRWLQAAMPPGLTFSPDASRETLILRAYFVLLGLPPTAEERARWLSVEGEEWFVQLIDHLLESPHYGERWARHWLDVAGYADSDGYTEADADRPWAWKYRDYVIRSINEDKPFDRFIHEQLAGDELAGPQQGDWTPEQIELLTATGFMRTAADGTGSGDNSPEARNKVVNDSLKIVGTALLGSSLHCAQCHDHRYDPISQRDFTAIRSVFEPALDWQNWQVPAARMVSLYTAADRQRAAEIEGQVGGNRQRERDQASRIHAASAQPRTGKIPRTIACRIANRL
jgi:mono/diheme cytochrome c family protein